LPLSLKRVTEKPFKNQQLISEGASENLGISACAESAYLILSLISLQKNIHLVTQSLVFYPHRTDVSKYFEALPYFLAITFLSPN
jgi:hypothetical protein